MVGRTVVGVIRVIIIFSVYVARIRLTLSSLGLKRKKRGAPHALHVNRGACSPSYPLRGGIIDLSRLLDRFVQEGWRNCAITAPEQAERVSYRPKFRDTAVVCAMGVVPVELGRALGKKQYEAAGRCRPPRVILGGISFANPHGGDML